MENVKYIPGDLVKVDEEVCTVEAMDRSRSEFDLLDEDDFWHVAWVNEIIPIPLTTSILEANGWKPITNTPYTKLFHKSNNFPEMKLIKHDKTFEVLVNSKTLLVSFRYCHQLQHLLFGLGLDSNIKV